MENASSRRTVTSAGEVMKAASPGGQLATIDVELHRVGAEEVMPRVAVELGPLATLRGVLDSQPVQPQLVGHQLQILQIRCTQIHPHDGRLFRQVLRHILQGEVLIGQDPPR